MYKPHTYKYQAWPVHRLPYKCLMWSFVFSSQNIFDIFSADVHPLLTFVCCSCAVAFSMQFFKH